MAKKKDGFRELIPIPGGEYDRWYQRKHSLTIPKDSETYLTTLVDIHGSDNIVNMSEVYLGDYAYNKGLVFSMNMNVGRSIPWIEDGLKSVERRILYVLFKKGLYGNKSTKVQSAVGSMIEMVYPHGDQSAADTIYRLGRSKTMMLPYVKELSNYGNLADLVPAAPRYAECALSDYAMDCFFGDIGPKRPLYDEKDAYEYTGKEPVYLISRYPNILMQWNQGIGHGASAWLGAFNSKDIFNAALKLMDNPNAKIDIYPDTPVPVQLVNTKELKGCFDKKKFKVKMRAPYYTEVDQRKTPSGRIENKYTIVFTAIPISVTGNQIRDEIRAIKKEEAKKPNKRFPELLNMEIITDDSPGGIKIIMEYEYGYDPHVLAEKLYRSTSLAKTVGVKYSLIFNYKPENCTPRKIMLLWINQRYDQKRRYYHQIVLKAAKDRAKYEAIMTILGTENGIDRAIKIVRNSKNDDESIAQLRKEFDFTEFQARVIISMKLSNLQKMDIQESREKRDEAIATYKKYRKYLSDENAIKEAVREELQEGLKKYGRPRIAELTNLESDGIGDPDDVKYLLYNSGYYYCLDNTDKIADIIGSINNEYKLIEFKNNDNLLIFDKKGGLKILNGYAFNLNTTGVSMQTLGVSDVVSIIPDCQKKSYDSIALVTEGGYGKVMALKDVASSMGKPMKSRVIILNEGDSLAAVIPVEENGHEESIVGMIQDDKMYYVKLEDIPRYKKSSAGNRLIKNVKGLKISNAVYFSASENPDYMLIYAESGYIKLLDAGFLSFSKRGNNTISLGGKKIIGATLLHGAVDTVNLYLGSSDPCKREVTLEIGNMIKFSIPKSKEEQRFKMSTSIGSPVKVLRMSKNTWYCIQ